jgi:Ca2+-binding EF-hand superfamily protein
MFQRSVCLLISTNQINVQELELIRKVFMQIDADKDGKLSLRELREALWNRVREKSPHQLEDLF